jgi:hypothetical protein
MIGEPDLLGKYIVKNTSKYILKRLILIRYQKLGQQELS